MPAETERREPSDPTGEAKTQPDPTSVAKTTESAKPTPPEDTKRSRIGGLLRRSKRRRASDEMPDQASDTVPAGTSDEANDDTAVNAEVTEPAAQESAPDDDTAVNTKVTEPAAPANKTPADKTPGDKAPADKANEPAAAGTPSSNDDTAETRIADTGSHTSDTDRSDNDHSDDGREEEEEAETGTESRDDQAPTAPATEVRRVWRSSRGTVVLVIVLMVVIGIAVPAAAALSLQLGVTGFGDQQVLVLSVLGGLAVLMLFFGWRLALHPRLVADGAELVVFNPFRTHRLDFADITLFAPGGDGLVIGTAEDEVEAWCIQKTTSAIKAERTTRADKITDELWQIRDGYHRPVEEPDEPRPAEIRFAHHDDAELLTQLERSASLARLGHIFPPDRYGFPEEDIRERWNAVLADRTRQTMIAEIDGEPAGYVSIGIETLHHMGVAEGFQRRGIGSELLEAAEDELFADASMPEIELWVLEDNEVARTFYRDHGWADSEDERDAEFPPYPLEVRMVRRNPHLARRGR